MRLECDAIIGRAMTRNEIETLIKLTIAQSDLSFTRALMSMEKRINEKLEKRNQFIIATSVSMLSLAIALFAVFYGGK